MDFSSYRYHLTLKQMRTIFGLCEELSKIWGIERETLRETLKINFCEAKGIDYFSCSPYEFDALSYSDAVDFIEFLKSKKGKRV